MMSAAREILDRYEAKIQAHSDICASAPEIWHCADVTEFFELRRLLLPHAEAGDMFCQYALATILWLGLCCSSEEEIVAGQAAALEEASRWWSAAAKQGYLPALDNLASSGVGAEAERAKAAFRQIEQERRDLVFRSDGMPVYGPEFIEELCLRLYGKIVTCEG